MKIASLLFTFFTFATFLLFACTKAANDSDLYDSLKNILAKLDNTRRMRHSNDGAYGVGYTLNNPYEELGNPEKGIYNNQIINDVEEDIGDDLEDTISEAYQLLNKLESTEGISASVKQFGKVVRTAINNLISNKEIWDRYNYLHSKAVNRRRVVSTIFV